MGSPAELTLYYRPPPSPESGEITREEYIAGLVEERRKIQSFQRELPLCMHLINQAIEACQNSHPIPQIGSPKEELEEPQNYVISEKTCILKEFIPLKRSTDQDFLITETQNSRKLVAAGNYFAVSKSENARQNDHNHAVQRAVVIDQRPTELAFVDPAAPFFRMQGGAFSPFCKKLDEMNNSMGRLSCSQSQQRKQRRCWSPDLHRRFLNALQHLGGSQVATPKEIKEFMSVDGLTNDEVKSHLQKYRLHLKKLGPHVLSQTQTVSVCRDRSVLVPITSAPVLLSGVDHYQPPISSHSLPNPPFNRGGRRRSISSKNSKPGSSFWKGQQYSSLQESRECPHPDSNPRTPRPHYGEEANSDVENNNSSSSQSTPKS